jgi:hypothetical protein
MKRKTNQFVAIILVVSMIPLFSCKKEKEDAAPLLPPMSSFAIDVSAFAEADMKKVTDTCSYFHIVSGVVSYWNLALSLSLAIPVASYAEALKQDAVRLDNDTWTWSYAVNEMYSADLVADVVSDSVYFGMYITKTGAFDSLLWFSGKCDILRTGGEWTIFNIPLRASSAWLAIDWNADYETETFDIKYTVVDPENEYCNSYIEYGKTADTDYDVYYDLYNSLEDILYTVNFNSETEVGFVAYDGNQYCWNENHANCVCP